MWRGFFGWEKSVGTPDQTGPAKFLYHREYKATALQSALGGAAGSADFHGVRDGSCGADRGIRKGQRRGKDRHGPHQS